MDRVRGQQQVRPSGTTVLVVCTICLIAVHASTLGYRYFANVDESYAIALAQRVLDGHPLYEEAISQRGPLMYYAYVLIAKVGGWDNVLNLRFWALGFAMLHIVLVYWGGRKLISERGAIFALLVSTYSLTLGLPPYDRLALNGEYLQLPPLVIGVVLGALAVRRRAPRNRTLLFFSGVALGAAIAVKQSAGLHVLPLLLWLFLRARRTRDVRASVVDAAITIAGMVIIPLVFIIHAWRIGTLHAMYYYCVEYNIQVHVGQASWGLTPASFEVGANRGFLFGVAACTIFGIRAFWVRLAAALRERSLAPLLRAFDLPQYLALHLAIGLVSAVALKRFFSHYFILSIPIIALITGRLFDRAVRSRSPVLGRNVIIGVLGTLVLSMVPETFALEKNDGRVAHDKTPTRVSQYIDVTTPKDAKIFVWGFSPWLYSYSHRKPAGRYVFSTYVTGLVPWRHDDLEGDKGRVVPGSNEALMADLDAEKPELVVDAGSIMLARPMRTFRFWADWLWKHYCFELRVRGFDLYRRKPTPDFQCLEPGFPQPQRAFDWSGAPLLVSIPKTSDPERTKWLFVTEDSLPAWYPESKRPEHAELLIDSDEVKPGMRLENVKLPDQKR